MAATSNVASFPGRKPETVRDLVRAAQAEMRADLQPERARELLLLLSALLGNVNAESREADDTKKELVISTQSLKKCIDSLSDEMRLSR